MTPRWRGAWLPAALTVLVIVALATRLSDLGLSLDRDGYDEGVYWQTLRALHAGFRLYKDIFFSQPPGLTAVLYPLYQVLGGGIWAARAGIASISMLGLAGAYVLGHALSGRAGGLLATALAAAAPLYLAQSRTLEAEGPAAAALFVTIAAGFVWSGSKSPRRALAAAFVCGAAFVLGASIKLLNVTVAVPLLVLAWAGRGSYRVSGPALAAGAVVATVVIFAPYVPVASALWAQVWSFHIAARDAMAQSAAGNAGRLRDFVLDNACLTVSALLAAPVAAWRRDWRVIPLVLWLAATLALLASQVPMFPRHAIVLLPPLIALVALGAGQAGLAGRAVIAGCLAAIVSGAWSIATQAPPPPEAENAPAIVDDLRRLTAPDQWIMTDAQFAAALAGRDVPPALVDTSHVRIESGYLDPGQLIAAAWLPRTAAVLFATGRLTSPALAPFRAYVTRTFRLSRRYGDGMDLWTRPAD